MSKLRRTLLLIGMWAQCRADREQEWQTLHQRDRKWFRTQKSRGRWRLMQDWLREFADLPPLGLVLSPLTMMGAGMLLGVGLMSGLLQFQPLQRINIWWWLLLAVWLPALWWLVTLWLNRSAANGIWAHSLLRRLPTAWRKAADETLVGLTAQSISQQFSLAFGLGLVASFFAYLLLTDLAFGWSSTLDVSAQGVHGLTQALALPWSWLWPEAVPSLELVEQSRFFRAEASPFEGAGQLGDWWRFLVMNLLAYVLAPRVLVTGWTEWRLARAQHRLFDQDACIDGWWQRLHGEQVRRQAESAPRNRPAPTPGDEPGTAQPLDDWPRLDGILTTGEWSQQSLAAAVALLPEQVRALPLTTYTGAEPAGRAYLLLCKGWEPPTGELVDLCQAFHQQNQTLYLWPVPLPGLKAHRMQQLRQSWQLFVPRLPSSCHLLSPKPDA